MEHILIEAREEESVFSKEGRASPRISDRAIAVEECVVTRFVTLISKVDHFLTWGAGFTVFAQKPRRAVEVAAYLANVLVLKTDITKPPKGFTRIAKYTECK